jgi:hypothetical protein
MRKLIVSIIMSLDGYYEGPGKDVMVLPLDGAFDAYNAERLRAADTLLLGRTTYEGFKGFWPSVADDPSPQWTPTHREISRLDNVIDKVVISDSITSEQTEPWHHNTRIIRRAERSRAGCRAQTPDRQRDPGLWQPHTLERSAGQRSGRRAAPDDRPGHIGRRHANIRRRAGGTAPARRHAQVGWLREPTRTVRGQAQRCVICQHIAQQ